MPRNLIIILTVSIFLTSIANQASGHLQKANDGGNVDYPEWKTNTAKRSIKLQDLITPGVTKDGIPSIDSPRFVTVTAARSFLSDKEPVIALQVNGINRAYPLQILLWHEIVND